MNGNALLAFVVGLVSGGIGGLWLGFKLWRVTYITRLGPPIGRL